MSRLKEKIPKIMKVYLFNFVGIYQRKLFQFDEVKRNELLTYFNAEIRELFYNYKSYLNLAIRKAWQFNKLLTLVLRSDSQQFTAM